MVRVVCVYLRKTDHSCHPLSTCWKVCQEKCLDTNENVNNVIVVMLQGREARDSKLLPSDSKVRRVPIGSEGVRHSLNHLCREIS